MNKQVGYYAYNNGHVFGGRKDDENIEMCDARCDYALGSYDFVNASIMADIANSQTSPIGSQYWYRELVIELLKKTCFIGGSVTDSKRFVDECMLYLAPRLVNARGSV